MTFIVRLTRDEGGRMRRMVERVRTGEKAPVEGLEVIAGVIARMAAGEGGRAPSGEQGSAAGASSRCRGLLPRVPSHALGQ